MDNRDREYLEHCLKHTWEHHGLLESNKTWYSSGDTMFTVAIILNDEGYFNKPIDVIRFYEKPWKYESDMREIIKTYNEENDLEYTQSKTKEK